MLTVPYLCEVSVTFDPAIHADEVHGRAAPLFETAAEPYRSLNGVLAVGRVVELSQGHIRYELFVVE